MRATAAAPHAYAAFPAAGPFRGEYVTMVLCLDARSVPEEPCEQSEYYSDDAESSGVDWTGGADGKGGCDTGSRRCHHDHRGSRDATPPCQRHNRYAASPWRRPGHLVRPPGVASH